MDNYAFPVTYSIDTRNNSNGISIGQAPHHGYGDTISIGYNSTTSNNRNIAIGYRAGNHKNFDKKPGSIHISSENETTFISEESNVNIANVFEADTESKQVIIPGGLTVYGPFESQNVAKMIDTCDACNESPVFGFEWEVIDEDQKENVRDTLDDNSRSESICLRCIRLCAMQFVAKENWANIHGDPISNLRKELTTLIDDLIDKAKDDIRNEIQDELNNKLDK